MMEPPSDILILKKIYEAERRIDQFLREAEREAEASREAGRAGAEALLKAKTEAFADQRRRWMEKEISRIEQEGEALIERAREEADHLIRSIRPGIDRIVEQLLGRVIPP